MNVYFSGFVPQYSFPYGNNYCEVKNKTMDWFHDNVSFYKILIVRNQTTLFGSEENNTVCRKVIMVKNIWMKVKPLLLSSIVGTHKSTSKQQNPGFSYLQCLCDEENVPLSPQALLSGH